MKKFDPFNFLFVFLCLLLLGFVYLNNRMVDTPTTKIKLKQTATQFEEAPLKEIAE